MLTLSIQIQNGFEAKIRGSSSIRNVLLKTESMSTLSIQGCLSRKSSIPDERNPSGIRNVLLKRERNIKERSSRMKVVWVENLRYRMKGIHLVFEMFYSKEREILKKGHPEWRFVDTVDTGSSGIEDFLLKPQTPVSTVSTNIAFNALYALIFV